VLVDFRVKSSPWDGETRSSDAGGGRAGAPAGDAERWVRAVDDTDASAGQHKEMTWHTDLQSSSS
jgi:hypothetical protein